MSSNVHKLSASPVKDRVSADEWDARVNLAACYRIAAHYRMTDLIYTHISARVPGPEHHFLINPYGFLKAASELVVQERARRGTVARVAGVQGVHWARPATELTLMMQPLRRCLMCGTSA